MPRADENAEFVATDPLSARIPSPWRPVGRKAGDQAAGLGIAVHQQCRIAGSACFTGHGIGDFIATKLQLSEEGEGGFGGTVRDGNRRVHDLGCSSIVGFRFRPGKARSDDAAFAQLADRTEGQAFAIGEFAIAIFGAPRGAPPILAPRHAKGDRVEVFEQRAVLAQLSPASHGLSRIDDVGNRVAAAQSAIAVDRGIDRQGRRYLKRLGQAKGGKAAIAIFANVLPAQRGDGLRAFPWGHLEPALYGARIDLRTVRQFVKTDDPDILCQRISGANPVPRR